MRERTPPEALIAFGKSFPVYSWWWFFVLLIVAVKLTVFGLDPLPRFFMGDSGSYLWTAFSGWIPPDRSFLYGFLIRWTALATHSLTTLLLLQTFLAILTAICLAMICRDVFSLSPVLSCLFGFLCAVDPLQWVWERYLMTETISLFLYATLLVVSFFYLQQRRLWQLALVQGVGVVLISFRISYLLVVEASTILLPAIAFASSFRLKGQNGPGQPRFALVRQFGLHWGASLVLFFVLHQGYKQLNGHLAGRAPAYLYSSGFSILASWAPTLRPTDSPDKRLSEIIAQGAAFRLRDIRSRNNQLYSPDSLVARWKRTESDIALADRIAKETALHSLLRRPLGVVGLGARTFFGYFDWRAVHRQAKYDLGRGDWPKGLSNTIAARLRLSPPGASSKAPSILQQYFLSAQPYYYVVLFCPLVGGVLFFFSREPHLILLLFHSSVLLATNSFLAVTASVRYLQPMSLLTILILASFVRYLTARASHTLPAIS